MVLGWILLNMLSFFEELKPGSPYLMRVQCPFPEDCSQQAWKRAKVWGWTMEAVRNQLHNHLTQSRLHDNRTKPEIRDAVEKLSDRPIAMCPSDLHIDLCPSDHPIAIHIYRKAIIQSLCVPAIFLSLVPFPMAAISLSQLSQRSSHRFCTHTHMFQLACCV